jgi:fimbrial chaperone protein
MMFLSRLLCWPGAASRGSRSPVVVALALLLGVSGIASPSTGSAATFTVEPTQVILSARSSGVLLTLTNGGDDTLRFELSVFGWTQSPSGEVQLQPTDDIVFFPSLLTLAPHESRKVRVGSVTALGMREKTYRIFVEELPPPAPPTSGVRVLTKMGIPIFLRPAKEVASATLSDLGQQNGTLRFSLGNAGTVHFVPTEVRVRGLDGSTEVFDHLLNGWYILAGGRREFEMMAPQADCARVTAVVVNVQFGSDTLEERLQTPNGVCSI